MHATTAYGYDGIGYSVGDRVELHPGMNLWMQGARYGTVSGVGKKWVRVRLDRIPKVITAEADRFRRIKA